MTWIAWLSNRLETLGREMLQVTWLLQELGGLVARRLHRVAGLGSKVIGSPWGPASKKAGSLGSLFVCSAGGQGACCFRETWECRHLVSRRRSHLGTGRIWMLISPRHLEGLGEQGGWSVDRWKSWHLGALAAGRLGFEMAGFQDYLECSDLETDGP